MGETIKGLRNLADFLEAKQFDVDASLTVNLWTNDKDTFLEKARKLGTFEKRSIGNYLVLRKDFGGNVSIELNTRHEVVCEKIVHQRVRPAVPETVLPALPERIEEVVEWDCPPSILAGAK